LKASDIYVHTSHPGGALSTPLLQAMASSAAIIASPHEGAREVIANNRNGLLLGNSTAKDIREALLVLLESKERQDRLGKAAQQTVQERFLWDGEVQAYKKLSSELDS